jgi:RNA polymerase primary sigma factor
MRAARKGRRNVLALYAAGRLPPLSRAEERALLAKAQAGDGRARDRLIRANLGYVFTVALSQKLGAVPLEDVAQEGALGLMRAIVKFDLAHKVRFGTYAINWIRAYIGNYLRAARSVVRPRAGSTASADFSLDEPLSDTGDGTHLENVEDEGPQPDALHAAADHDARVRAVIARLRAKLGPLGWDIVQERLSDDRSRLEDLGKRHGVSRERVRQVEMKVKALLARRLKAEGLDGSEDAERQAVVIPLPRPPRAEGEKRARGSRGAPPAPVVGSALRGMWVRRLRRGRGATGT